MNGINCFRLVSRVLAVLVCAPMVLLHRLPAQPILPGAVDESFYLIAGESFLRDIALCPDGKSIIVGFGNTGAVLDRGIAKLNTDGTLDPNFDVGLGANNHVWTVALQPDGKVLIAGDFTSVNGTNRSFIARLNSDGSLDASFDPGVGPNATVWALAIQSDGRIVIAGEFLAVSNVGRVHVARLNSDGTLDTSFETGSGVVGSVRTVALQSDGRAVIAGNFTTVDGVLRPCIARLNANGSLDTSFATAGGANDWIISLAVQPNDQIIIGGFFTSFAGLSRNRIARLNQDGTLDTAFDSGLGANDGVAALALQTDGKVILGGGFTTVDGRVRSRFARLHPTGRLDSIFEADPGANNWVEAIAIQNDGKILIAGNFGFVNGIQRGGAARLFGGDPPPFAPVIVTPPAPQSVIEGSDVTFQVVVRAFPEASYQWQFNGMDLPGSTRDALVLRNVRLANAGTYTVVVSNEVGVVQSSAVLSITPAPTHPGAADIDFYTGLGLSNVVHAIALHGQRIVTGGGYWLAGGPLVGRVMRLENNGAPDPTFFITPFGPGSVETVGLEQNGNIVVGGSALAGVRRLLSNGTVDGAFNTATNPPDLIHSLSIQSDGRIVAAGSYSRNLVLRRFLTNGPLDVTFASPPPTRGAIHSLARQADGRWLIGGEFTTVFDAPRNGVARIHADGGLDVSFDPASGANSRVLAVVQQPDGRVLLAGQFTRVNGVLRNRIARLFPNGAVDLSFNPGPGPDNNVMALALQPDGRILIGGAFEQVNGIPRGRIARLHADGSLDFGFDTSAGADDAVQAIVALPDGRVLVGGSFQRINAVPRPGIARLRGGGPTMIAPSIVAGPTNQAATSGADVTFVVVADGSPTLRYQWQVDGVNIPHGTNWILTLANVRTTNSGAYRVVVSNPYGAVTSAPATLTVTRAPRHAGAPDIEFSTGSGPNDRVHAIALEPSGKIIIGGAFTHVNGIRRGGIARLERSGALDSSFDPGSGANGAVYAIARQPDGALIVGGNFTRFGDTPRLGLAKLDAAGTLDTNFIASAEPGPVFALALQNDGKILVGGAVGAVAETMRRGIARLETNGVLDLGFATPFQIGAVVYAIDLQQDGRAILGGFLPDSMSHNRLVRLQPDGLRDLSFAVAPGPPGPVYTLSVLPDDRILSGGDFISFGSNEFNRITRVLTNGLPDPTFHPGAGANNAVRALALQANGLAVVGGAFDRFDDDPLARLTRLRPDGSIDSTFNIGSGVTDGTFFIDEYGELVDLTTVNAVVLEDNGRILIGGDFTKVDGVTRPYLARVYDRPAIPMVRIRNLTGPMIELEWEFGVLEHATELSGPWRDVVPATNPVQLMRTGSQRFFRLRVDD